MLKALSVNVVRVVMIFTNVHNVHVVVIVLNVINVSNAMRVSNWIINVGLQTKASAVGCVLI